MRIARRVQNKTRKFESRAADVLGYCGNTCGERAGIAIQFRRNARVAVQKRRCDCVAKSFEFYISSRASMRKSLRQTGDCHRAFRAVRQLDACGLVLRRLGIRQSFNRFSPRGVSACVSFRRRFAPSRAEAKVSLPPTRMNGVFLSGSRFFAHAFRSASARIRHSSRILPPFCGARKNFSEKVKKRLAFGLITAL